MGVPPPPPPGTQPALQIFYNTKMLHTLKNTGLLTEYLQSIYNTAYNFIQSRLDNFHI